MSGVRGVVRVWHDEEGWGVVDSEATPGGCWAHFSAVLVAGFRRLRVGQEVLLEAEAVGQDGYAFRAVEVWPADAAPVRTQPDEGPSAGYRSGLTISLGEDR